ncbi:MAG: 30S ribosomal protein S18 [Candidatus Lambdaproteobacteria bacterium RIFOXYD1_FULL_56_27]|uniref:Small ribosomal subunit protein bS18 n=1 Tax=Candidatus Lambdaproteobacteria bacterium RIFOXYD2_FULL_56_26 TaxID=1817773 RepID=A0A1F6GRR2_9PROT|nr:MAG: 30S ribosomal protein S18 [Candidatus Lambdaproteobacteria bacterium RIFOXYC1_FULL_56_13]OGH00784.1 MAG: 30S ribosomal protein S18 [Candidatus Lambdaproteobacteria bacterium RIFOXYD2_FULL_56_26]OGH09951.1 MAG: 30S ribosomal protein S18 [Candidatus Lambdaproteobacteria bacterium RIFOXYD1_FULL_56_27]
MGKKRRNNGVRERVTRRPCPLEAAGIVEISYKDIELLRQFITEKGKIIPRRITGLSSKSQKLLTQAIKQARNAALLSFADGYVFQDDHRND